ncbi:MAG: ribonuclease R [Planctomycetaceae bacterium]|nr:ribonuclease R [Planctomycetaceae bacterium]
MTSLSKKLLETLARPDYQPVSAPDLAKQLNITKKNRQEFSDALDALLKSGQVRRSQQGLLRLRAATGLVQGMIKKTAGGAGFLIPHKKAPVAEGGAKQDIFIAPHDLGEAHTGDEVLVQLLDKPRDDGRIRGRIVEILTRSTRTFVGTYFERDEQGWVQVDGSNLTDPVFVGDPGAKGAQTGDKVVFEMVRFPSHARGGEGVLTNVLGPRGEPGVDTLSIIHEFGIPDSFPDEVLEAARSQTEQFDEDQLGGRLDLTGETIVTIDPVDARDFDDAISLSQSDDGHWHLGVHIADVAHFVRPGSPLDDEAYKRGTSVYLPDRVIPMLPELISNSLASLQQGKVRFTKSAIMEFTDEGMPVHTEFANSAIKVTKRFAYEEVMPIINEPEKYKTRISAKVRQLLDRMYKLAMRLRARRFAMGALELNMPEVKIDFDKQGRVSGAHVSPHDPSHQIIEECMLAANMAVATALGDRGLPFLRRLHADPDEAKLRAFAEFVTSLGYPLKRYQSRPDLQKLLDQVQKSPHRHAVNYALLRSLKQAEYSPEELGHYALAAENYCHFTSPIRRYPDLTVHRLIGQLTTGTLKGAHPSEVELIAVGQHCSRTERRAEQAERELVKVKLLTYMSTRIGEEFEAIITGVQDFGFFCQAVEVPAEGLVHVSTLDDDNYYYEQATHTLIGRRSGKQFRLGSRVQVVVALVDVDRRQLDFRLAGSHAAKAVQRGVPAAPRPGARSFPTGGRPGFGPTPARRKPAVPPPAKDAPAGRPWKGKPPRRGGRRRK